jgi:hypothetical protein
MIKTGLNYCMTKSTQHQLAGIVDPHSSGEIR